MIGNRRIDAAQEIPMFYKPPYVTNKEARLSIENKKKDAAQNRLLRKGCATTNKSVNDQLFNT